MRPNTVIAGLLAAALALSPAPGALAQSPPTLPAADRALISGVEDYLNGLHTLRARFTQTNADGTQDHGVMWLERPGRARIEYAPPTDVLVVADGTWLIYYDAELDQVSHVPIDTGPFRFLLEDHVNLSGDVAVTSLARSGGIARITLADPENPGEGRVTLVFEESPLKLRQWEVLDAQGFLTIVTLHDEVAGGSYPSRWFYFPESARKRDFRVGDHD
jgi:outer membrane lipoprotein-sorting protein